MNNEKKPFEVAKTFGLGVLFKLTKKTISGIEISSDGEKFISNLTLNELSDAVNSTIKAHNISLKLE
ncbi:MAG: hypothetical protein K8S13_11470 [Desulfobacula sp.]|uniref:hypothetical protein n=1 Tax=Desulfobacula sp. TaxID=2593537 RepID=UPI0025C5689D|nr:hypothetical protein [Desulfobacula sp.]MCD4720460.1 hypothetical protein [Desulfobacula sp.]